VAWRGVWCVWCMCQGAVAPVRFACLSRPGNDPMKRIRENQDCFTVVDGFAGRRDGMMLGVFDGHGPHGKKASEVID
jgi:serine/threonine protein phosphatase PrpC